jgi:hypothetical protein
LDSNRTSTSTAADVDNARDGAPQTPQALLAAFLWTGRLDSSANIWQKNLTSSSPGLGSSYVPSYLIYPSGTPPELDSCLTEWRLIGVPCIGLTPRRPGVLPLPGVPLSRDPRSREPAADDCHRGPDAYFRRRAGHWRFVSPSLLFLKFVVTRER